MYVTYDHKYEKEGDYYNYDNDENDDDDDDENDDDDTEENDDDDTEENDDDENDDDDTDENDDEDTDENDDHNDSAGQIRRLWQPIKAFLLAPLAGQCRHLEDHHDHL